MLHNEIMEPISNQSRQVLELARQKGFLRASDLDQIHVSRVVLARLSADGLLEKVSRGYTGCQAQPIQVRKVC